MWRLSCCQRASSCAHTCEDENAIIERTTTNLRWIEIIMSFLVRANYDQTATRCITRENSVIDCEMQCIDQVSLQTQKTSLTAFVESRGQFSSTNLFQLRSRSCQSSMSVNKFCIPLSRNASGDQYLLVECFLKSRLGGDSFLFKMVRRQEMTLLVR